MASKDTIILRIATYIVRGGGKKSDWYVGISADPSTRLSNGHGVKKGDDWAIIRQADSEDDAREIEKYFLKKGYDGGDGGGKSGQSTRYVYAYKKAAHTTERT